MKKLITCILIVTFALVCLCACKEEDTPKIEIVNPTPSYDSESRIMVDTSEERHDEEASSGLNEVSDTQINQGGFVVKEKKYTYKGTDHVFLFAENQTDKNYTVTVTGTYYDKDGNALKTEQHTFEGFGAGLANCFLFSPDMTFDSFAYTLDAMEYSGVCYANHIEMKFSKLRECRWPLPEITNDHMTYYPQVDTSLYYYSDCDANLAVGAVVAVFDPDGNLAYLATCGKAFIAPMGCSASGGITLYYELTEGEMQNCPEWIKNEDFTMAVALLGVSDDDTKVPIPVDIYPHLWQWYQGE